MKQRRPHIQDFDRIGWIEVVRAMDVRRFKEPRTTITDLHTKRDIYNMVIKRVAGGEAMPNLKEIVATWKMGQK